MQYIPEEMYSFRAEIQGITYTICVKQAVLRALQAYYERFITTNRFNGAQSASEAVTFFCSELIARQELVMVEALGAEHYAGFVEEHGPEYANCVFLGLMKTFQEQVYREFVCFERMSPVPFLALETPPLCFTRSRQPVEELIERKRPAEDHEDEHFVQRGARYN